MAYIMHFTPPPNNAPSTWTGARCTIFYNWVYIPKTKYCTICLNVLKCTIFNNCGQNPKTKYCTIYLNAARFTIVNDWVYNSKTKYCAICMNVVRDLTITSKALSANFEQYTLNWLRCMIFNNWVSTLRPIVLQYT